VVARVVSAEQLELEVAEVNPSAIPGERRPAAVADCSALGNTDRVAFATLEQALVEGRRQGDLRPPFTVLAACLDELGVALPQRSDRAVSLEHAQEQWLQRLRNANRSPSTLSAYRVALDDLIAFLDGPRAP
jgi:hypothetical protein